MKKQFGFRADRSTNHALLELINQICECFDEKKYLLGIFVDLSKAFDAVDHEILITKLIKYGECGKNLLWFSCFENNILNIEMSRRAEIYTFFATYIWGTTRHKTQFMGHSFFNKHK